MRHFNRDLWPWFIGLVVSLAFAYWASLPRVDSASAKVAIISIQAPSIASMELIGPDMKVAASRRTDVANRWWISYERKSKLTAAESSESAEARERFMASEKFKDMLDRLAPFQALRVIGKVSDDQMAEFGLRDAVKTLSVRDSSGASLLSLAIGKQLYGSRNVYVLHQPDQKVLLVDGDFISDFEKPELRVFERSVSSISPEDVQSAVVSASGKSRRFGHTKRDSKGSLIWTVEGGDDSAAPQAATWFDKFSQLKAAAYASDEDQKALAALPALFEVEISGAGAANETLQIRKRIKDGAEEYWLTSTFLSWHVKIAATRAQTLDKDLHQLIGG